LKNQKNLEKNYSHIKRHDKITYLGSRNPWTDRYKILHVGCRSRRTHACQLWWRSVKGFRHGDGSNFGLFHWLASSPLQHWHGASVWLTAV